VKLFLDLWTIPAEVKFYCLAPFLSILVLMCGEFWFACGLLMSLFALWVEFANPFGRGDDAFSPGDNQHAVHIILPIFLKGTILGIFYYYTQKDANIRQQMESKTGRIVLSIIYVIFTVYQYKECTYRWNHSLLRMNVFYIASNIMFVSTFALLAIAPNFFTNMFNNEFLVTYGKYGYGVYLFHIGVLRVLLKYKYLFKTSLEPLILSLVFSHFTGVVWYHIVENPLMNIGNILAKKLETLEYFQSELKPKYLTGKTEDKSNRNPESAKS
jgi:peptidoglycan/LPS O-acetylase OafA/YrhL